MKKPIVNVCLIGCGRAGMIHARSYAGRVPGARLIALCDPFEENLNAAQAEINVPYLYTDYREAVRNPEVDAVVVVTPTNLHCAIVLAAAANGKHVFCEKPMADSEEECRDMIRACREAGVKLQIGFMRRFDRNFRKGKMLVDSGRIGDVTLLKSNTYGPSEPKEWMYDVRKSCGPLGEVNSHDFDTLRWFALSEATSVHVIGRNFRSPEKAEQYPEYYDTCAVLVTFANGVLGTITGAQYVRYGYDARCEILGTKGIVKVGAEEALAATIATQEDGIQADHVDSWRTLFADAYVAEDIAFVECIRNDTDPEVTGHDGLMALKLVNAALQSLLEHRTVELSPEA